MKPKIRKKHCDQKVFQKVGFFHAAYSDSVFGSDARLLLGLSMKYFISKEPYSNQKCTSHHRTSLMHELICFILTGYAMISAYLLPDKLDILLHLVEGLSLLRSFPFLRKSFVPLEHTSSQHYVIFVRIH